LRGRQRPTIEGSAESIVYTERTFTQLAVLPSTASNIPHIDTVRMSGLIAVSNTELSAGHGQCTKFPSFSELKKSNVSTHAPVDSKSFQSQSTLVQRVLINSAVLCNISLTRKFLLLKQKREQLTKRLRSAIGEEELEVSLQLCKELTSENFHDSSVLSPNIATEYHKLTTPFIHVSATQRCREAIQKDAISDIFDLIELLSYAGFFDVVGQVSALVCEDLSERFVDSFTATCSTRTQAGERFSTSALHVLYNTLHKFTDTFNKNVLLGKANIHERLITDLFNTWAKLVLQFLVWFDGQVAVIDLGDSRVSMAQLDAAIEDIILVDRICKAQHSLFKTQSVHVHISTVSISKHSENLSDIFQHLTRLAESCVQFENIYIRKSLQSIHVSVNAALLLKSADIDDLFFLIGRSIRRVFGLTSVNSVCSLIVHICAALKTFAETSLVPRLASISEFATADVFEGMTRTTAEYASGRLSRTVQKVGTTKMHDLFLPLNNAELLLTRVSQITQEIGSLANSIFLIEDEKMKVIRSVELLEYLSRDLRFQRDNFFAELSRDRMHCISPIFEQLACSSYVISEEVYRADDQLHSWVDHVLTFFYHDFRAVSEAASCDNVHLFVTHSSEGLSKRLENVLKTRLSFNHLGSLKFERELRQLISGLSSLTHFRIRQAFTRLVQITVLLSAETLHEVDNYLVDMRRQSTWKLSESDVLQVMKLRVDL
jgi:conserved oligomeric Golgi complex subunit 4